VKKKQVKRNLVLGILFFLPVVFLLFLYPSTHNYNPLEVVNKSVSDIIYFNSNSEEDIVLKDHITILGFFGTNPASYDIAASNLKELVYDKFKGFKRFQIIIIMPEGTQQEVAQLHQRVSNYEDVRFWHYVYGQPIDIQNIYSSLKSNSSLNNDLSTEELFIIDKDLNQRGRYDDRTKKELETQQSPYPLYSYNSIDIDAIKNKMNEDMRILFTEYRQKRKGNFDSSKRRADDIKTQDEKDN
jgi:hypothetical protein